jgi:uncharacterized protein (TIGR02466 family)
MNASSKQAASLRQAIERPEVLPLFPTFVWKTLVPSEVSGPLNLFLKSYLDDLVPQLARGEAWQSNHDLHHVPGLEQLVACIDAAAESVLDELNVAPREVEITACWATVNAPGRGHAVHAHPNCFLSGVYYVLTHAGADTINFHDPRSQTGIIRPPVTRLVAANADQAVVTVSDGALLLFPSWLQHSVDPNASECNRISVSFNLMFSAYTEALCRPLWQGGKSS